MSPNDSKIIDSKTIREEFDKVEEISFFIRQSNLIEEVIVSFGKIERILLLRVLEAMEITPEMLRSMRDEKEDPEKLEDFKDIGRFCLFDKPFLVLSKVLNKKVKVYLRNLRGEHFLLSSFSPNGETG